MDLGLLDSDSSLDWFWDWSWLFGGYSSARDNLLHHSAPIDGTFPQALRGRDGNPLENFFGAVRSERGAGPPFRAGVGMLHSSEALGGQAGEASTTSMAATAPTRSAEPHHESQPSGAERGP
jgi:hypothetical protein